MLLEHNMVLEDILNQRCSRSMFAVCFWTGVDFKYGL